MKESVRIFRFIVIGTMNALIMVLVVWLMMKEMSFDGDYMVANITAYLIAQIHNFIWCKYWIFPVENKKNSIWKQILLFCSAFGLAYTAQFLFLVLLVDIFANGKTNEKRYQLKWIKTVEKKVNWKIIAITTKYFK